MALMDTPEGLFVKRGDGQWEPVNGSMSVQINGDPLVSFDHTTGTLRVRTSPEAIDRLVSENGGLPIQELVLEGPPFVGRHRFRDVRAIIPIESATAQGRKGFLRRILGL